MPEPIILEKPLCPLCKCEAVGRVFYHLTENGPVAYKSGETIDPNDFFEVLLCQWCDR